MQLRADFLVGKQTPNSWSGVYGFKPDDSIEPLELFAIIKLASQSDETGLEPLAKMFLDELQNYLFSEGKEGDYIIRLENAVWKMKSKMEVLLSSDERYSQNGLDIEVALTLFDRNFLYVGVVGESKIYIQRGDRFVELSKGLTDGNMMGFLKTGSLELEPGDRLALSTSSAAAAGEASIESALGNLNVDNLSSLSSSEGVGILLLADEKDTWAEKTLPTQEEFVEETTAQENDGSAKYIPIQEEDFDDTLETPTEVVDEGLELEPQEEHLPVNQEDTLAEIESVQELNTNLDTQEAQSELPVGRQFINNFRNKLVTGFNTGKTHMGNLKVKVQEKRNARNGQENVDTNIEQNIEEAYANSKYEQPDTSEQNKVVSVIKNIISSIRNFANSKLIPFFKKSNKTYIKYLRDFVLLIVGLLKKLLIWFKKEFIGGGVDDRRDIFAKAKKRKRNRLILVALVVVLGVLIISAINNRNAQLAEEARIEEIRTSVDSYNSQLDNLVKQANVNLDDAKKTTLLDQLDKLNNSLEAQKKDGMYLDSIASQQDQIVKTKDKITGSVGITQPQVVADVGKIYSDANLTDLVYTQGNLYASDKARNTIYQFGTNIDSEVKQFATGLNAPFTMTTNVDGDIIFYDSDTTSSVGKLSVSNGTVSRFPGLSPAVIGSVTKATVFSGNNALYELHQNHQQIYKREQNGDEYVAGGAVYNTQNPPNWKTDPELGSAIDIDVPYEIYVLIRGKGLRRYLGGEDNTITQATFINTTKKDYDSIASATAIDIDGKLLAVADPTNRRVLLFTIQDNDEKTLAFLKAYVYRGNESGVFKNIKELAINEASNNIFVLDGTSIIRLDL